MIDASLGEFLTTVTTDFNGLIGKIDQMKENMSQLKQERQKSSNDLEDAQDKTPSSPYKAGRELNHAKSNSFGGIVDNPTIQKD